MRQSLGESDKAAVILRRSAPARSRTSGADRVAIGGAECGQVGANRLGGERGDLLTKTAGVRRITRVARGSARSFGSVAFAGAHPGHVRCAASLSYRVKLSSDALPVGLCSWSAAGAG